MDKTRLKIRSKIIEALLMKKEVTLREIAGVVRGEKAVNKPKCEARCKYHIDEMEAVGILKGRKNGSKKIYCLNETSEVLEGKMILWDTDGNVLHEDYVGKVVRFIDTEGEQQIVILEE
jgi:hypothetical protein